MRSERQLLLFLSYHSSRNHLFAQLTPQYVSANYYPLSNLALIGCTARNRLLTQYINCKQNFGHNSAFHTLASHAQTAQYGDRLHLGNFETSLLFSPTSFEFCNRYHEAISIYSFQHILVQCTVLCLSDLDYSYNPTRLLCAASSGSARERLPRLRGVPPAAALASRRRPSQGPRPLSRRRFCGKPRRAIRNFEVFACGQIVHKIARVRARHLLASYPKYSFPLIMHTPQCGLRLLRAIHLILQDYSFP